MNQGKLQNDIRINHRGFLTGSPKRFVLVNYEGENLDFSVCVTENVEERVVFSGKMQRVEENEEVYFVGDFFELRENGDYHILAGGKRSRQFVIYDGAYDICKRMLLEYFTYQRCGHALGWAGECHLDDGYIAETGEHVDLSGGYHQSCDLRKSPGGVSIGVNAMLRFAVKDESAWGKILVRDEAKWALEYFIKTIQQNGAMYNTLNSPFGWQGRVFYKSPAPSSAQWNVTSCLALGYEYFRKKDGEFAKRCLDTAKRSFDFLMGESRPSGVYTHPDKYPLGMDPDFFYEQCVKDSTADLCYQILACADMYRQTDGKEYLEHIKKCLPSVLCEIKDGFVLMRREAKGRTVSGTCSYSWLMGGLLSLIEAYELIGDECGLEKKLTDALSELCTFAKKSVWRRMERTLSLDDIDVVDGHEGKTKREMMGEVSEFNGYFYSPREQFEPSYACYIGIFLAKGARAFGNSEYLAQAQAILDQLLGGDELDSSRVRGIGFNSVQHYSYGQFFPSTPFIPGAVGVGYSAFDTENAGSEYDMPCVGLAMYLISEIERAQQNLRPCV